MDYEKKYKEALERAKAVLEIAANKEEAEGYVSTIFPELKEEFEDERISKEIIKYLEQTVPHNHRDEVLKSKEWTAWLEKQGEQSSLNINRECLKGIKRVQEYQDLSDWEKEFDNIASMYAHNKNQEGYNDSWYVKERAAEMLYYAKKELEKQGEKPKPSIRERYKRIANSEWFKKTHEGMSVSDDEKVDNVNNIEPKFKVGNWVVSPNGVYWHIDAIQNGRYEVTSDTGQCGNWPLDTNIYRLWTIQDAKDGDVLVDVYGNICIYEKRYGINWHTYCYLENEGRFISVGGSHGSICYPATKEQRDLLFQKMHEAGYEWDSEKKELKKIKQKPATIDIDKMVDDYANNKERGNEIFGKPVPCMIRAYRQGLNDAIGKVGLKPAWSKEDEKVWKELIEEVKDQLDSVPSPDCRDKEDEKALKQLTRWLVWLQFLKERYTWKPSDEQITVLELASKYERVFTPKQIDILICLKEQLKKLRGE